MAINLGAWDLASCDMSADHKRTALLIFGTQVISLAGGLALSIWLWTKKENLGRLHGLIPLGLASFSLAMVFMLIDRAIPSAVADWMLPRDQWLLKQFALLMPAALFGAFRLLCPNQESEEYTRINSLFKAIGVCAGLFALSLGYLFFCSSLSSGIFWGRSNGIGLVVVGLVFAGYLALAVLAAAGLLRVCISLYSWARARHPVWLVMMTAIIAIVGPLGGLFLNSSIPFPSDFQTPGIYLLALINGLVLTLPNFAQPQLRRVVWLTQCVLFPFTAYFFFVFLPFLTLGPISMLVLGLGSFMYVPSLLFLLHGCRLIDGYLVEARHGVRWGILVSGVAAILVWPLGYTAQARLDRAALHRALDYLQYPDYSANSRFGGSITFLRSSLTHLRDFKQGMYLPYLSEYYNWLAFDNLVLPKDKLDSLVMTFLGKPLPESMFRANQIDFFSWGGTRRGRNATEVLNGQQGTSPQTDAVLQQVKTSAVSGEGIVRATAALTISNPTTTPTEFRTVISVPPGVMISNMWLTIGTERVAGKIFEKRSAIWVYQKITEVRPVPRDPAILRYTGPNQVELRVYPVEAGQPRLVEVEFLYPESLAPRIEVASHGQLDVPGAASPAPSIARSPEGNVAVAIPALPDLPSVIREPYFHFLVDVSKDSSFADPARFKALVEKVRRQFPNVKEAKITFVNYETEDLREGKILPLTEILQLPSQQLEPRIGFRGGFLPSLAIREVLWRQQLALENSGKGGDVGALSRFPQIVVLRGSKVVDLTDAGGKLADFARWLPDMPGYWIIGSEGSAARYEELAGDDAGQRPKPKPIHIYQAGGVRFAGAFGQPVSYIGVVPAKDASQGLEVFDAGAGKFAPANVGMVAPPSPSYQEAIRPWSLELGRIFEPFKNVKGELAELLKLCRETGILVPSAAYMVVENTAQWKMLERTEKKALKGHEALALSEPAVPEPGTLLLLISGLVVLYLVHPRTHRRGQVSG